MTKRGGTIGVVAAVAVTLAAIPSAAEAACPADPALGPGVAATSASVEERLRFVTVQLDVGARRSRGWAMGWGLAYGSAAIAQLAAAPYVSKPTRIDLYVGATSATIGVLTRSIMVPKVIGARRRLRRRLAAGQSPCEVLHATERDLARAAKSEAFGRSLLLHLAALVYNAGIGVVLGVAFDRPVSAARQATIGATVGQVMIVTQPTTMVEARARYRDGDLRPAPIPYLRPLVLRGGGGVVVGSSF